MTKVALFPGSFDPLTNGHLDLIARAAQLFDQVLVAIPQNTNKKAFFSTTEKVMVLESACQPWPNVTVLTQATGLTVDLAREVGATHLVRGLRSVKDFEYEKDIAIMNRELAAEVETVFFMTDAKYAHVSSSLLKEIWTCGGDISSYVPVAVQTLLAKKQEGKDAHV